MEGYARLDDSELVARLLEGDENSFVVIYERFSERLYHYAYKKLQDKHSAEDVVHDVFMSLWHRRNVVSLKTHISSYLFSAVRNKAFDMFAHRKVKSRHLKSLQEFLELSESSPADFRVRRLQMDHLIQQEIQASLGTGRVYPISKCLGGLGMRTYH